MDCICNDCPRACSAERKDCTPAGFCRSPALPVIARAAPHFGEEPCISGTRGSGAVFFSGCNLRCIFCQNAEISRAPKGKTVTVGALREILERLQGSGVHNLNLVTASHYTRPVREALGSMERRIPVVWNSSAYESVETLKTLEGLIDVYLPDLKYMDAALAERCSKAADYPRIACAAIEEMYRLVGECEFNAEGILTRGVIIRHLILPGELENSKAVIDWVARRFPNGEVLFSLMSQYTPMQGLEGYPKLRRRVSARERELLNAYALDAGIARGYTQDADSATTELLPAFDLTGV